MAFSADIFTGRAATVAQRHVTGSIMSDNSNNATHSTSSNISHTDNKSTCNRGVDNNTHLDNFDKCAVNVGCICDTDNNIISNTACSNMSDHRCIRSDYWSETARNNLRGNSCINSHDDKGNSIINTVCNSSCTKSGNRCTSSNYCGNNSSRGNRSSVTHRINSNTSHIDNMSACNNVDNMYHRNYYTSYYHGTYNNDRIKSRMYDNNKLRNAATENSQIMLENAPKTRLPSEYPEQGIRKIDTSVALLQTTSEAPPDGENNQLERARALSPIDESLEDLYVDSKQLKQYTI